MTDSLSQPLRVHIQEAFDPHGVLAQSLPGFTPREGQTQMALAVGDTLTQGGALVVEAGTGVGKTFAYLVPALLSGERVLVSTATKTLQDQLFSRDLPRLKQTLGIAVRLALLKGRGSYLCIHRMQMARQQPSAQRSTVQMLAKVELWSQTTTTGDLAELPGLDERSSLLPLITSNRENCLGSQCPSHKTCHVNQARREALAADVVVINHHLFFADMAVRESGMAELLPSVRVVIFDEAHQLNETGVHFLGRQLSTAQLLDLTRDALATGLQLARGLADWQAVCAALEKDARDWRLCAGRYSGSVKLRWVGLFPEGLDEGAWLGALGNLTQSLQSLMAALDSVSEIAPDFLKLHDRAANALDHIESFSKECAVDEVRWLDVSASQMRMMQAPLDISETVQQKMLVTPTVTDDHDAGVPLERPRSWVFTSATLGDDDQLSWFTQPCGLQDAQVLRVSSPFDYPHQAALYVPRDVVLPNQPQHSEQVAHKAIEAVRLLQGRTLVLTTTLRALRQIGEIMREPLAQSGIEVLIQGEKSKRELMQTFRQGAQGATRGYVLVASASFWEGFDVPGDALELVIIDKLPFPVPNDPVVEARSQRLEQQKRNAFTDFFVPEAAVALKQGVGRLIRHEQDRGGLMICDKRLVTTGYGKRLMAALPNMRRIDDDTQWQQMLTELASTKAATTP